MTSEPTPAPTPDVAPSRGEGRSVRGMPGGSWWGVFAGVLVVAVAWAGVDHVMEGSLCGRGGQIDTTRLSMRNVQTQVDTYAVRKRGQVPTFQQGLPAIFGDMDLPRDGWGNQYLYISPGPDGLPYDLISFGADGKVGGSGENADIALSNELANDERSPS